MVVRESLNDSSYNNRTKRIARKLEQLKSKHKHYGSFVVRRTISHDHNFTSETSASMNAAAFGDW